MDSFGYGNPNNAPQDGGASFSDMRFNDHGHPAAADGDLTGGIGIALGGSLTTAYGTTSGGTTIPHIGHVAGVDVPLLYDNGPPTTADSTATQACLTPRGGGTVRGGRGRRGGSTRGHGSERGGPPRPPARKPRHNVALDDNKDEEGDEEVGETPKRRGKKRQKTTLKPEAENQPAEIHRRRTSLRDRLIKGDYEPQAIGMRVYNMKKAAAANASQVPATPASARNSQEFLIPVESTPAQAARLLASGNTVTGIQPNHRIAYKSTPIHQLHFPEALVLAVKQNTSQWEAEVHDQSSVFVVVRIVGSDIADMNVFTSLRDATADALYMILHEHPEAFVLRHDKDGDGNEIKHDRSEQASTAIQQIRAWPTFQQVPMTAHQSNANEAGLEEEASFFMATPENPALPQPPHNMVPQPNFNNPGELLPSDAPEPTYVFSGNYGVSAFDLKIEARRADGTAIKVSVHLKSPHQPIFT